MRIPGCLLLLIALTAAVSSGSTPGGEMLGKVVGVEHAKINDTPWSACAVIVFRDSSYAGAAAAPGDTVRLWMPGGRSIATLDGPGFTLSTVPMIVGEKVFVYYRTDSGRLAIEKKWTVWKKGDCRLGATAVHRKRMEREDVELEALLASETNISSLQDSLELFSSRLNPEGMLHPTPGPGVTWRDYGLLAASAGTLRSVRETLRLRRAGK